MHNGAGFRTCITQLLLSSEHPGVTHSRSVLQIRRGNKDNLGMIFFVKNIHCDPSLEPSRRDGSNERSQRMFSSQNKGKKNL